MHLYANATQLYTICDTINARDEIRLWFESNGLVRNASTSALMQVKSNAVRARSLPVGLSAGKLGGVALEMKEYIKNLGVVLDYNLNIS